MLGYGSSLTLPPTITEVGNGFPTHGEHGHSQATTTQNTNSLKPINKNIESFTWICDCLMLGKSSKHILLKWWPFIVMNPTAESKENNNLKQIQEKR